MTVLTWLRIAFILLLVAANCLVHVLPVVVLGVVKAVLPFAAVRRACNPLLTGLAESWIAVNTAMMGAFTDTGFDVLLDPGADLRRDGHYLVLANHQSWVDILVLQEVFTRRIPLLRFFLKRQLFWVPLLGLAWWALDFPFMGRYSKREIARNPELGKRDMEATRRACAKFVDIPVSVMNFVEGTRYTPDKHASQASPYRHLLKPKAGALALSLHAMGEKFDSLIDVTIVYPHGRPTFWQFMCGRVPEIVMRVHRRPIPPAFCHGDYSADAAFRAQIHGWLADLWAEKDAEIERLLAERRDPA